MTPLELVGARVSSEVSMAILRSAHVVGIVGSRGYPEPERVAALLKLLAANTVIISGGAEGPDRAAVAGALGSWRPAVELKPIGSDKNLWVQAAHARNGMIALCSDVVVAFWDGQSSGTADTISKALKLGKCIVALPGQAPQVWVPAP